MRFIHCNLTYMLICCPAHADQTNVEARQAYHRDENYHTNPHQDKSTLSVKDELAVIHCALAFHVW